MDIKARDIIVYGCGKLIVTEVLGSAQLWELDTIAALDDIDEDEDFDLRECDDAEMLSVGTAYRVAWLEGAEEATIFTDGKFIFFGWNAVLITPPIWYHNSNEKFRSEPIVQVISGREAA